MARYEIVTWNQKGIRLQWLEKKKKKPNSFQVKHILVLTSSHGRICMCFSPRLQASTQAVLTQEVNRKKKKKDLIPPAPTLEKKKTSGENIY